MTSEDFWLALFLGSLVVHAVITGQIGTYFCGLCYSC